MQIAEKLFKLKDIKYKDFHAKLIPNVSPDKIIGVRTPSLRTLVKSIKNGNNKEFFDDLPHNYYEENNVHAFLISEIRDFDKCIIRSSKIGRTLTSLRLIFAPRPSGMERGMFS